jgi:membrane peptidoglycan carboxypeptidase
VLCAGGTFAGLELRFSWLQSRILARASARMEFYRGKGPSPAFAAAPSGPYDLRLGYAELPRILKRTAGSYYVIEQARSSESLMALTAAGGYPIYAEKSQAGLLILDRHRTPLFAARYPREVYPTFDSIPPLVVQTLLFIENRKILDDGSRYQNPAVEWNRLAKAAGDLALNKIYPRHPISGGSTLATQLEKVRHSPEGRTQSTAEKFRQMLAASLRAYRNGEDTTDRRREIVRDYLNSFPLGALPGYGEVAGLPEGLLVWFGADPEEVNRLLCLAPEEISDPQTLEKQAAAYRQVLSLLLSLNRPTFYLRTDRAALAARTDRYLRLLEREGLLPKRLSQAALRMAPEIPDRYDGPDFGPLSDKGTLSLRASLLETLGVPNTYALDRMDLKIESTFDGEAQRRITQELRALKDPGYAAGAGLQDLLGPAHDGSVIFSFTLYERTPQGNLLRVEADNYDQPLSINRGTRLELGSTAKLRTVVTYLEIVASLHAQRAAEGGADPITRWAMDYLRAKPDATVAAMLEAALDRSYSANPAEKFFTGGGLHTFSNFDAKDNHQILTVREAFGKSVNLVFIRLMRDIESYFAWRLPAGSPAMLADPRDPRRKAYLERFAAAEGREFLEQFWNAQRGQTPAEALDAAAARAPSHLGRLTIIYRSAKPRASQAELANFLRRHSRLTLSDAWIRDLYRGYDPQRLNWNERGSLSRMHPLELWLLSFRMEHPDASFSEAVAASKQARQEAYQWLFQARNFEAQNLRIRTMLEQDAFAEILKSWKRQGYPFANIVPSYASTLGSSGDNPAALAELAGIILNDGVHKPDIRIQEMHFAEGTLFDTRLAPLPRAGTRVYPAELARVVKNAMFDVVKHGTGRRAYGSVVTEDRTVLEIGGKTGTGDNRLEVRDRQGRLIDSRAINRTATFVFVIGDRFFGTVTAYVPGPVAGSYRFTSALPVQLFRRLAPNLEPLLRTSKVPSGASRLMAG